MWRVVLGSTGMDFDQLLPYVFTLSAILAAVAYFALAGKKKKGQQRARRVLTTLDVKVTTHTGDEETFAVDLPLPMSTPDLRLLLCSELGLNDAMAGAGLLALKNDGIAWPDGRDVTAFSARGLSVHVRSAAKALPKLAASTSLAAARAPEPTKEEAFPSLLPGGAQKIVPDPRAFAHSKKQRMANTGGG